MAILRGRRWSTRHLAAARRRLAAAVARRFPGLATANAFELYLTALVILGGLPLLLGQPAPQSIARLLPRPLVVLWGAELLAGGVMLLAGLALGRAKLQLIGLRTLAIASSIYAVAILALQVPGSANSLGYIGGFAVACFAQVRHVRHAAQVVAKHHGGHDA